MRGASHWVTHRGHVSWMHHKHDPVLTGLACGTSSAAPAQLITMGHIQKWPSPHVAP